jgi:hypothetical protein
MSGRAGFARASVCVADLERGLAVAASVCVADLERGLVVAA